VDDGRAEDDEEESEAEEEAEVVGEAELLGCFDEMLEIKKDADASRLLEVDAEADADGVAEVDELDEVGPADTSADEETAEPGLVLALPLALALALALMLELDPTALDIELAAEGTNTT
jgi:hypothetical protein